jgi:malate dehydrogenase
MTKTPVKVAVTGAAGNVAYSLLFSIAQGNMLGADQPIDLRLVDIEAALGGCEGRALELQDCAFGPLVNIEIGSDPKKMFDGVDYALLVGSMPRKDGMDRADLLKLNGAIFKEQGEALNAGAANDVKILVTGNPANTNCSIALAHAKDIPASQFAALTRLDHDRAKFQLANKLGVRNDEVKKMAVWGNHSNTMYADVFHAEVDGQSAWDRINDMNWLENEFIPTVAGRGGAIIKASGKSSAASAANATWTCMRDWVKGTANGDWVSMGIASDGSYGVPEGLISSYPVTVDADGYHIVQGLEINDFSRARIQKSVDELQSEHETAVSLGVF